MKKITLSALLLSVFVFNGCKKDDDDDTTTPEASAVTTQQVLDDFAHVLANPNYVEIASRANTLNTAVQTFNTTSTDNNLLAARQAWKDLRQSWERCESFLFGPVEDFNYDPMMDTWPVNQVDLDSLLASSNGLTLADIDNLPESLKGFHPIEYIIFGVAGTKLAVDVTAREKQYLLSLTQSLANTTADLRNSWDVTQSGNFTNELVTAGSGSVRFNTRKDALIAIVTAMGGICDEVANGKMEDPLAAQDSTLEESQFAHNSTTDFQNNMIGVLNVYLGKYSNDGRGLNDLVAAKNLSLDNTLQSQMNAAVNAFNSINSNYGEAIYTQQVQIHAAQDAINALRSTIENDLLNFIQANIND
jgi:putative iron-regulated protein